MVAHGNSQSLNDREKRCATLMALGLTDHSIARELTKEARQRPPEGVDPRTVRVSMDAVRKNIQSAISKLGLSGRVALALWMADNLDADRHRTWLRTAAERREQLLRSRVLTTDRRKRLVMLLADPAHCDDSNDDLGQLCTPPMSGVSVGKIFKAASLHIGSNGGKIKLAVILHLAPLELESSEQVPQEMEV